MINGHASPPLTAAAPAPASAVPMRDMSPATQLITAYFAPAIASSSSPSPKRSEPEPDALAASIQDDRVLQSLERTLTAVDALHARMRVREGVPAVVADSGRRWVKHAAAPTCPDSEQDPVLTSLRNTLSVSNALFDRVLQNNNS